MTTHPFNRVSSSSIAHAFNGGNSSLNFGLLNIRSLVRRIDEVRLHTSDQTLDVLAFTESWLSDNVSDPEIALNGYSLYRKDRSSGKKGGGVLVYVKKHIKARAIKLPNSFLDSLKSHLEFLLLEISVQGRKILVVTFYNPPRASRLMSLALGNLDKVLDYYCSMYPEIVVMGDFNYDLLKQCPQSIRFQDILRNKGLFICNEHSPTRSSSSDTPSLLDVVAVHDRACVSFYTQLSLGLSDHEMLLFSLDVDSPPPPQVLLFRDYKNTNFDDLPLKFSELPWDSIYSAVSSSEKLEIFNHCTAQLLEAIVPIRKLEMNSDKTAWFNNSIRVAIQERITCYKSFQSTSSPLEKSYLWIKFKSLRNKVNSLIKSAKNELLKTKLDPTLPPKLFWSNVKSLGLGKKKADLQSAFSADELNQHFVNPSRTQPSQLGSTIHPSSNGYGFSFSPLTTDDLILGFRAIKSKAVGLDDLNIKFLRSILIEISPFILHIFNHIITSSDFPYQWKIAKIIPIPKVKLPSSPNDFRPIAILASLSKVFEWLLKEQMITFIEGSKLFNKFQSGFRKGHGTHTAMLKICDDLRRNIDQHKPTLLVLLDFAKAFDSVNHDLLCSKLLAQFGFSSPAVMLIRSYLTDRFQEVHCNDEHSSLLPVNSGVPQGSILGPLLFSLFINDVSNSLCSGTSYHLYADDLQLYLPGVNKCPQICINKMNQELGSVSQWASDNCLKLNVSKSQAIFISKPATDTAFLPPVILHGDVIPYSKHVRNLGLILNETLTWDNHVNRLCSKIFTILRSLWRTTKFMDKGFKKRMFTAFILPHFLFCDVVLFGCSSDCYNKIRKCYNACLRYVHNLRKYDHISHIENSLLDCSLKTYLDLRVVLFIYRIINVRRPEYILDKLVFGPNYSRNMNIGICSNSTETLNSSFFVKGIALWNRIPASVKRSLTFHSFKSEFLNWIATRD